LREVSYPTILVTYPYSDGQWLFVAGFAIRRLWGAIYHSICAVFSGRFDGCSFSTFVRFVALYCGVNSFFKLLI
jgi:hypothetical protein